MIQVVHGGSMAADAMIFGVPSQSFQAYLAEQFTGPTSNLTAVGKQLYDSSKQLFERYSGDNALRMMASLGRAVSSIWKADVIRPIMTIADFQFAQPAMQRWIMAEPTVRQMYHQQRVEGYDGQYCDMEPGSIGHAHYDYRRAMQGMMQFSADDADDETPEWSARTYWDELYDEDRELSIEEKADIQHTWRWLHHHLKGNDDPTSRFNASLG